MLQALAFVVTYFGFYFISEVLVYRTQDLGNAGTVLRPLIRM